MGKKSKGKNLKCKASAASGPGGSAGSSNKAQKCTQCCATVKANGQRCPGCSDLYCWRCEKKYFDSCPNGSCCVHPLRRCIYCLYGQTMQNTLATDGLIDGSDLVDEGGGKLRLPAGSFKALKACIERSDELSDGAIPLQVCQKPGCRASACFWCFHDTNIDSLGYCSLCKIQRCKGCYFSTTQMSGAWKATCMYAASVQNDEVDVTSSKLRELAEDVCSATPDGMLTCRTCEEIFCYECAGIQGLVSLVKCVVLDDAKGVKCQRCYWSAKPCSNPTCRNEAGVPTKRCGDCRVARYCSKECQKAAYIGHVNKCRKIQEKRAARGQKEKAK